MRDVGESEIEVLEGAGSLLTEPHHWVVEVHRDLTGEVVRTVSNKSTRCHVVDPKRHWLLGAESPQIKTSWVTTRLE